MQNLMESNLLYNIGPISAMTEVYPRLWEGSTAILKALQQSYASV